MPMLGNPANVGLQTTTVNPLPTNVSTVDLHTMLYAGATTRIACEDQPWFLNTGGFNGHKNIGMDESNAAQRLAQAAAMKNAGCDLITEDYYGCAASCGQPAAHNFELSATTALVNSIAANPSSTPKFAIMIDAGAISGSGTGQCQSSASPSEACIEAALNAQMDYICVNWLYQSYYETNATNGHPIVLYFLNQSGTWSGTNFNTVFSVVAAHATAGNSCGSGHTYTTTVDFIDENAGAFSETGIAGGYAWPQPNSYSSSAQLHWQGQGSFDYLADFYSHARSNPSKIAIGLLNKGFDDKNASWGSNRVIAQQCGQVLGLTAAKIGLSGYSSSSQLQYVQVSTWNDYEEGTAVEMGIDNCITLNQPTIGGGLISWGLLKRDATYASTSTINSLSIYTGTAGPTTLYASGISPSATSFAAPPSSPGQSVYVYAVGGPLIQNRLSAPVFNGPSADNIYCPASGIPVWSAMDGPSVLPLVCYNTAMSNTPANSSTVNVSTSAQLITALAAATCGQTIILQSGTTYSGHFTIPAIVCPSNNYLWIETSGLSSLPPEGFRVSPCYAGVASLPGRPTFACPTTPGNYMAKLTTPDTLPVISFNPRTSSVRFIGLEITRAAGGGFLPDPIKLGNLGNDDHLIFDRCWIHGVEQGNETENAMDVSAASYVAVIDSYLNDFYCVSVSGSCTESHVILGGTNTVNSTQEAGLKIVNNYLEGSSVVFLVGAPTNTTPGDIEIRLNTIRLPLTWNAADPSYNGGVSGHPFIIKNLLELKNAQRALLEGNAFQNIWGEAQNGSALLLTPKNQGNGIVNQCPNCFVANITVRYNTFNTVGAPFQLVETFNGNGAFPAGFNNVSIHDTLSDNINYAACGTACIGIPAFQVWERSEIATVAQTMKNFFINHNTTVYASTSGNPSAILGLAGPLISTGFNAAGLTFTNNVGLSGATGTGNEIGSGVTTNCSYLTAGGTATINACWAPNTVGGNCFITNGTILWPGVNVTSLANQTAAYLNYNNGNGGNYTLSANGCQGKALDGTDPGVNMSVLASVLAGNPAPSILNLKPPAPSFMNLVSAPNKLHPIFLAHN